MFEVNMSDTAGRLGITPSTLHRLIGLGQFVPRLANAGGLPNRDELPLLRRARRWQTRSWIAQCIKECVDPPQFSLYFFTTSGFFPATIVFLEEEEEEEKLWFFCIYLDVLCRVCCGGNG